MTPEELARFIIDCLAEDQGYDAPYLGFDNDDFTWVMIDGVVDVVALSGRILEKLS